MTYHMIQIKRAPGRDYQAYTGWDAIYTDRAEADAALARARRRHYDARIAVATRAEAEENGWLPCCAATEG